jgi:radical S-adenosyl methionine domain-containing protein 2
MLSIEKAKEGVKMLASHGMRKLNFAGGEPFLKPKFLGPLVQYAKEELQLESVSIVSNGSLIKENWLKEYGKYIDILAVSCDSFNEDTNIIIGRGKGKHIEKVIYCYIIGLTSLPDETSPKLVPTIQHQVQAKHCSMCL